jgi:hypothetical protein
MYMWLIPTNLAFKNLAARVNSSQSGVLRDMKMDSLKGQKVLL